MRNILPALLLLIYNSRELGAVTWLSPADNATLTASERIFGTVIATLNATEANAIIYNIISEFPAEDKFGIQNYNELYLKRMLDYETTTSYRVVSRAYDVTAREHADITVILEVLDVNDNPPRITSPTSITLLTHTALGTVVYTITSTDVDTVGNVTYSIKSWYDNGRFIVNSTTGNISLNTTLDIRDVHNGNVRLFVEANDGIFSATQNVIFFSSNVFWQTPIDGQIDTISEDTLVGTVLLTMFADNAIIYYFDVNPASETYKFREYNNILNREQALLTLEKGWIMRQLYHTHLR